MMSVAESEGSDGDDGLSLALLKICGVLQS